jgi:hypothetical protein
LPLKLETINIFCREKEGGAYSSGRGDPVRELHPRHLKTSNVSIRRNDAKINMILTFPSSLQLLTIDINRGEEAWGVPRSSGRRDPPRNSTRHPVEHHEVSFG